MKKNVHDAAWSLEKVIAAKIIATGKTTALVYVIDERKTESDVESLLKVLGSVTRVINLQDQKAAIQEFRKLFLPH